MNHCINFDKIFHFFSLEFLIVLTNSLPSDTDANRGMDGLLSSSSKIFKKKEKNNDIENFCFTLVKL